MSTTLSPSSNRYGVFVVVLAVSISIPSAIFSALLSTSFSASGKHYIGCSENFSRLGDFTLNS